MALAFGRVDQGVDFGGAGAINVFPDTVTVTDIGSTTGDVQHLLDRYVIVRFDSGPYKGHYAYLAEQLVPTTVVGQRIPPHGTVARATGAPSGIEIGFNKTSHGWNPVAPLNPHDTGAVTSAGSAMEQYLRGGTKRGGGFIPGAEGVLGDIWKYNPVNLPSTLTGDATSSIFNALTGGWINKLLAGFAALGGGLVFVVGLILIAADIGLSTRAGKVAASIPAARGIAKATRPKAPANSAARERRAEETHAANLKLKAARTKQVKAQTKNHKRTVKEQKTAEDKRYYEGARDAASPTMAKIRRERKGK